MTSEPKRRATYQDVLDAPEHMVAEIIGGVLWLSPRPASPHAAVASVIGEELGPPFKRGRGGPGGWLILDEPELHLGEEIVVPDLAGWRRERLPHVSDTAFIDVAPDWICEVLSKSNEKRDRTEKMPIYASAGVRYAWLVSAGRRTIEAFRLQAGSWLAVATCKDDDRARIEPFDAIELDLSLLWADLPLPTHASEEAGYYDYAG